MAVDLRHHALMEPDAACTPKAHLLVHLIMGAVNQGSPALCATRLDEALSRTIKAACMEASHAPCEASVYGAHA